MALLGISLGALLALIAAGTFWGIRSVRQFRAKEALLEEKLSGIGEALIQRYETLVKLMDTVGIYTGQENLLAQPIRLQKDMTLQELREADRQLAEFSGRLFAAAELYPELRASELFLELERDTNRAEETLRKARRAYNTGVTSYNNAICLFPDSLFSGGRQLREYFDIPQTGRARVQIKS